MKFVETAVPGVWVIEIEPHADARGFFARTFCSREFEARGLPSRFAQCNISCSTHAGTLRGMHYQAAPGAEGKLVLCTRGAIYDVVVDLRPASPAYCRWISSELTADGCRMLYIPAGCAHGFQTLRDDTAVFYQMTEFYRPECARGFRWNDPAFGIEWPLPVTSMSDRDKCYQDFEPIP